MMDVWVIVRCSDREDVSKVCTAVFLSVMVSFFFFKVIVGF